ncbi:MAG: putative histidinol dehydrogenase (but probably not), partial [uncultured Craurococcus sp.]
GPLAQAKHPRRRKGRCGYQDPRHRRGPARRYRTARRRRRARLLGEVRRLGPRRLPPDRCRDPRVPGSTHRPGPRGYPLRPGPGPQFRRAPEGGAEGHRGRDAARHRPRPQEHPGKLGRLLRPWRQVPAARLRPYVRGDGEGRRRSPHRHLRAPLQGQAGPCHRRRPAPGRRRRDLLPRRRPGRRRHGAGDGEHRRGRHAGRPRQCLRRRGQAPALWPRRHRPLRRPDRDPRHCRRDGGCRALCDGPPRPGRARPNQPRHSADGLGETRPRDHGRGRAPAGDPADRRDRPEGLAGLRRGDRLRQPRGDGAGSRPHRLRACPGDDPRRRSLPAPHDELRRALPRPPYQCLLWRQGHRHQPHPADAEGGALHRRPLGWEVPEDRHLPARSHRRGERHDRRGLLPPLHAGGLRRPCRAGQYPRPPLWRPQYPLRHGGREAL